jgi:Spy/CpxP family protein refolding chaperone
MNRSALPAALALVLAASFACAQQPQPAPDAASAPAAAPAHAPNPHRQAARLAKELNLTPDQRAKVEPILANRDLRIAALKANTAIAPADLKKQMHHIQKSTREQLNSVLTPDQAQQLQSIQQAHRAKGQAPTPAPAA